MQPQHNHSIHEPIISLPVVFWEKKSFATCDNFCLSFKQNDCQSTKTICSIVSVYQVRAVSPKFDVSTQLLNQIFELNFEQKNKSWQFLVLSPIAVIYLFSLLLVF